MPEPTSGSAIRQRMRVTLQPSTWAASKILRGILSNDGSSTQITIGRVITAWLRIRAQYDPIMPTWRNITYHGSRNNVPGAIRAASVSTAGQEIRVHDTA